MKKAFTIIACLVVLVLSLGLVLAACDLGRKVQGVEIKFQKKVEAAQELSFDLHADIVSDGEESSLDISCFKKGNEYAYTFVQPDNTSVVYRRLYADNKLYEYVTKDGSLGIRVGTYYATNDVPYTDENNLLYWVTQKIMLATYATLLSTGKKETLNGAEVYHYDFAYQGNQYALWYDDVNLVKISATFNSTDAEGKAHSETYTAVFSNYRFDQVDHAPFRRPAESTDATYVESPISFESWMAIINRFSTRAANWM